MAFCATDGNQGFPISITGSLTTGSQTFLAIQGNAELIPSFAQRTVPRKLLNQSVQETGSTQRNLIDESSDNTIMYRGTRYSLVQVQICQPTLGQGSSWPYTPAGTNIADVVFTFSRLVKDINPDAITLTVPLYGQKSMSNISLQTPKAQMYFEDTYNATVPGPTAAILKPRVSSLGDIFRELINPAYVTYVSCIPLRSGVSKMTTMSILGTYFPAGWILPEKLIQDCGNYNYNSAFAQQFIPAAARNSYPPALAIPPPPTTPADKINEWISDINHWSPYGRPFSNTISVSDTQFTRRFLWIDAGLSQGSTTADPNAGRLKTTVEYQCLPLDRIKDIDGNYVLLDPKTGARTLKDTLDGTPDQQIELALSTNTDAQANIRTFAIVIGSITAIIVLFVGISFAMRYVLKRADVATAAAATVAAAAATVVSQPQPQPPPSVSTT
jgi:hypothetical protein